MGVTQSLQRIDSFYNYHKLVQNNQSVQKQQYQLYFGPQFQLYTNKFNPKQQFTKHTIKFREIKEMENFINQVKQMKEKKNNLVPFNILYPINLFVKENNFMLDKMPVNCGENNNQVIVIHKWLGRTLYDYVNQSQNLLKEQQVWFIVNQLSKSLQILQENNHGSCHVTPQNIWHNVNNNWFLYDGRFVIGTEGIQQFYQQKLKNQHFVSQDLRKKIETNALIVNNDSLQQDVYCLGYCLIFMITGIHPKQMPKKSHQRDNFVNQLLESLIQQSLHSTTSKNPQNMKSFEKDQLNKFSTQLISFIKNLIKPDPKRRFTIRHIRSYLKSKQQQIFMRQEQNWSKSEQQKSSSRNRNNYVEKNLFCSWKIQKKQRIVSPQRQLQKRYVTQNSQGESNFTSMRTLKKQPISQKMVLVNSKDLKRPAFNLIENDGKNNKLEKSGQFTPIRKMDDTTSQRFNFQSIQKINKNQLTDSNFCKRIPAQINQMRSPQRCRNQLMYMSPKKQSNSSINTKAFIDSISHYENSINQQRQQTKPRLIMHSPSHYQHHHQVILSPTKVKLTYQSPKKPQI